MEMYRLLLGHFGRQEWWPGETVLEVMVGAVLTQNTNWSNVEKAIGNLKTSHLLSLEALNTVSVPELAERIRPAGYFNLKAGRLKNLVQFVFEVYDGSLPRFLNDETRVLRENLLSVKGIGPETADSIILYAAKRPVFVVDAYSHRILNRHGMVDDQVEYHELQACFMEHLPADVPLYNEFHALLVRTGKVYCKKKPLCDRCPLGQWREGPVFE